MSRASLWTALRVVYNIACSSCDQVIVHPALCCDRHCFYMRGFQVFLGLLTLASLIYQIKVTIGHSFCTNFFSLPSSLHDFFSCNFALHEFFLVFSHPSHHFSNGPSLMTRSSSRAKQPLSCVNLTGFTIIKTSGTFTLCGFTMPTSGKNRKYPSPRILLSFATCTCSAQLSSARNNNGVD